MRREQDTHGERERQREGAGDVATLPRAVTVRLARLLVFAFAAVALACEASGWLGGARSFDEIDVADAARQLESGEAWLIQLRDADVGDPRAPGATIVAPEQPLPDRARAEGRSSTLVIAHDDPAARRFASRLVRAGFPRVHAVRGGIQAWRARGAKPPERAATDRNG
jgi:rhodanese-related sulfurtransferase